jgi:heptosyltransferase-2
LPKFLIIRFSSIGDIVLTTPVVRCLKTQVKDAEVHFLTKKSFAQILEPNPYIDKLHLLEKDLSHCISQLKAENFDAVIDLHHNLRTFRVKRALGIKSYSFDKLNIEKWMFTALKINRLPKVHIVERYLSTLKDLGVVNDGKGLDYFIPETQKVNLEQLPETHRSGYIGLVIGATFATKKLPEAKLLELCKSLLYPVVLLGGPEDRELGERISANNKLVINACGKYKLAESADLIRQASLVITHDTGLMHIAAAFCRPIISIWGNTVPEFGMGPYYPTHFKLPKAEIFEVKELKCRPCSKIGYSKCPKSHFKCMELQNMQAITQTAVKIVQQGPIFSQG